MTIVLLQLPVPDHAGLDQPLAAACLENAWKRSRAQSPGRTTSPTSSCRFLHPPQELINRGSDQAILSWLVEAAADLVGFSLYLWNRERSQWLATQLRRTAPAVCLVAGGPEVQTDRLPAIQPNQPVASDFAEFDWLVAGPGEAPFVALLEQLFTATSTNPGSFPPGQSRVLPLYRPRREAEAARQPDPAGWSPWLDGTIVWTGHRSPVHLETVRGCPNKCSYCHYGKQFPRLLFLPEFQVQAIIEQAARHGCEELYLMDPSFSQRPRLDEFLAKLAGWNRGRLQIHTELRLEDITPLRARLLADAGIHSVEAGLQSTNPQALAAVGRTWNQARFEAGATALRDQGIRISTGIILGLPHDGPAEIRATMEYVRDLGLADAAEAYPLAVLPGTRLRQEADKLGLSYMDRPPYYLLASPWLDQAGMVDCLDYAGWLWNRENQAPIPPGLPDAIPIDSIEKLERLLAEPAALPRAFALRLGLRLVTDPDSLARLCRLGQSWRLVSPFSECRLIIDLDSHGEVPTRPSLESVREAFRGRDHLIERIRYYQSDPQGTWSCRLFVAACSPVRAIDWLKNRHADQAELVIDLPASKNREAVLAFLLGNDWDQLPFVYTGGQIEPELADFYEGLENLIE